MENNPYAAPSTTTEYREPLAVDDAPADWTVGSVLKRTWQVYRRHWLALTVPAFFAVGPYALQHQLLELLPLAGTVPMLERAGVLLGVTIVSAFVNSGWTTQWLAAAQGRPPSLDAFWSGLHRTPAFIASSLLIRLTAEVMGTHADLVGTSLPSSVHFLEGTVSGIFGIWTDTALASLLVERTAFPRALASMWRRSQGYRGRMVALGVVGSVLAFLSILACLVGLFPMAGYLQGISVIVYLRLTRSAESLYGESVALSV